MATSFSDMQGKLRELAPHYTFENWLLISKWQERSKKANEFISDVLLQNAFDTLKMHLDNFIREKEVLNNSERVFYEILQRIDLLDKKFISFHNQELYSRNILTIGSWNMDFIDQEAKFFLKKQLIEEWITIEEKFNKIKKVLLKEPS